ncbi:MAG: beta-galactosidase [Blastocatellia bacterium]|nr:MAG: beta-galactosidase [Blastocatellia bacterium]
MTRRFSILLLLLIATGTVAGQTTVTRQRLSFNEGWRFHKGDPSGSEGRLSYERMKEYYIATGNEFAVETAKHARPTGNPGADVIYTQREFDDRDWRQLDLPHDWGIEGPFSQELPGETGKLPWSGIGWYRKTFAVTNADQARRIYLQIDGAMAYAMVWLNGQFVGGWPYGYASFELDLTPYIDFDHNNVIAVRLDNPPDSSRWYPGGGIYRNVWLTKTPPVHVNHWGTYITTSDVTIDSATVDVKVSVINSAPAARSVKVKTQIYALDTNGQRIGRPESLEPTTVSLAPNESQTSSLRGQVKHPRLWSLTNPNLYTAVTTVEDGKVIDTYETTFGIRTIKFDAAKGFYLNGDHLYLKGVCDHHDLGALGSALNVRALQRQLEILREMGVNAIRTSHNPPAPELLDLADRMGFVVMDEAFDEWKRAKKKNGYHLLFDDWHEKDLRAQIRRDRNHPSVIMWSIGNEIGEQGNPEGHAIAASLTKIVHEEDPTRPTTAAANNRNAGYNGFQKTVDVFGYNYQFADYAKFRESNLMQPLFGSETASTVSSRGEYFFPVVTDKSKGRADFQVSSYDLYAPRWAWPPDAEFEAQDKNPFVGGEFVWTGFDYLGEPTPYGGDSNTLLDFTDPAVQSRMASELKELGHIRVPSRSSYFGIVDLCGFKKDRFYIYQARWRSDLPMAHILPHWNWPDRVGQVTPVHVYTSGDEAELFLNGQSLGRKKKEPFQYRLRWDDVKYAPGELRVVVYKNGKRWAEDVVKTTGPVSRVELSVDRKQIKADGVDLAFITVRLVDKAGSTVPRSNNRVHFTMDGPGEIVAVDNGDATSLESFQSKERNAYNGLALVIVRTVKGKPGVIKVRAESVGLAEGEASVVSRR